MATWHVTVDSSVGADRVFQLTVQCLHLKTVSSQLIEAGFSVSPMPEQHSLSLTVHHPSESALTLFRLRHDCEDFHFVQIS